MPDEAEQSGHQAEEFKSAIDAADLMATLPDATTTPEAKSADPWAASPWDAPGNTNLRRLPNKAITAEQAVEKSAWQVREERKEAITEAHLSVTLDRAAIRRIVDEHPELLGEQRSSYYGREAEAAAERAARAADLQATADALAALPEHLDFQPGITLIFGENGLGKSTLAKALRLAAQVQEWTDDDSRGEVYTLDEARDFVLSPGDNSTSGIETLMSGMAPYIARHVSIDSMANYGAMHYYDAAQVMGQHTQRQISIVEDYRMNSTIDVGAGRSHRQTVDDMFDHVGENTKRERARRTERAEYEARGEERPGRTRSNEGPQLYFFDEPEVGMSPSRQRRLIEQLTEITFPGSVIIVPTNSIVMYESDLPRIDLEHPERGIFRPSDYPDDEI
jgi:energy-coupling factor transporter ATP-binding protein EcfA2